MTKNFAADLREMLTNWNTIERAARATFPKATKEEVYKITAGAMNHSLGIK
jgi:hypothetical protein